LTSIQPARPTRSATIGPVPVVAIPKPGGGTRHIAVLDPADRRAYAEAVARVVPAIEAALGLQVLADRARVQGAQVVLADWRRARRTFREAMKAQLHARPRGAVFTGDVRACFPSIGAEVVDRALRRIGSRPADSERVVAVLRGFAERGITGLPVGPAPSAPLANAVLLNVDRAIRAEGACHLRWVDDVVVVCEDRAAAIRVADAFHRALGADGLHANPSKTTILRDRDAAVHRLLGSRGYSPTAGVRAMLRAP
jgi:hypothetical protein